MSEAWTWYLWSFSINTLKSVIVTNVETSSKHAHSQMAYKVGTGSDVNLLAV